MQIVISIDNLHSDVIAVTGPRQSGKTTLARAVFADRPYLNLEEPDVREAAAADPRGLLGRYPDGLVIDEAQRVPGLFSYLQARACWRRATSSSACHPGTATSASGW